MTPVDAAKLLEVAPDATPAQIEARYLELRARLEDKVAKAPTPGLKAKYREALEQITAAFEALTLAADGSALPVLKKETGNRKPETGAPSPREAAPTTPQPAVRNPQAAKKSSKEFLIVALIAVAVLGAGGWFVMKTRAEAAEKSRLEAQAKHEAEQRAVAEKAEQARQAESARIAAEQARRDAEAKRLAEEQERTRAATEAKAEQERQAARAAGIRAALVELKLAWEATEQDARLAERRAAQMRSDIRSAQSPSAIKRAEAEAAAHQAFADWFANHLARHPARIARVQAEELLSARQYDSAAAALAKARTAQQDIDAEVAATRKSLLTLTTSLPVEVRPSHATWEVTDAHGTVHTGTGAAVIDKLPFGPVTLRASLAGYEPKQASATLVRDQAAPPLSAAFVTPSVEINSIPQGAAISIDGVARGVTPLLAELPKPGKYKVEVTLPGHRPGSSELTVTEGEKAEQAFYMLNDSVGIAGLGVERPSGQLDLKVAYIHPSGPADEAGLRKEMVITGIARDGKFIPPAQLSQYEILGLLAGQPGTELRLMARAGAGPAQEFVIIRERLSEIENDATTGGVAYFLQTHPPDAKSGFSEFVFEKNRVTYRLSDQEYYAVRLPVGTHSYWVKTGRGRLLVALTISAGQRRYYIFDPLYTRVPFVETSVAEGAAALRGLKRVEAQHLK